MKHILCILLLKIFFRRFFYLYDLYDIIGMKIPIISYKLPIHVADVALYSLVHTVDFFKIYFLCGFLLELAT